jgi:hypothetical protein
LEGAVTIGEVGLNVFVVSGMVTDVPTLPIRV